MLKTSVAATVPHWVEEMLRTSFFAACVEHPDAPRGECNLFCADCPSVAAFCFYCRSHHHDAHRVVQIRRSSYHNVVRVSEVQGLLDISGVQTYVINSARVLFLNERPQPRGGGGGSGATAGTMKGTAASHVCEICARTLLDPFRFCSLGCKLVGVKQKADARFMAAETAVEEEVEVTVRDQRKCSGGTEDRLGSREGVVHVNRPSTPPSSRRRKGVPRRAPLAS